MARVSDDELLLLAHSLGQKLHAKGWVLSTAESCTGGWVAQVVTAIPGSSAWFDRGFITYSNRAKQDMLGVNAATLDTHGAVSEETVKEMATGALARSQAHISVALSGIAGPGGGTPKKPVGTVCIGWATHDAAPLSTTCRLSGDREEMGKMKEEKAVLAGEMSGHLFFADRYFGYDDAIYAAARLLEILSKTGQKLSDILADVPRTVTTPEIRIVCPDEIKFDVVREVTEIFRRDYRIIDTDGVRILSHGGSGLIRASNTQPVLVLRFESSTKQDLASIRTLVEKELSRVVSRYRSKPSR